MSISGLGLYPSNSTGEAPFLAAEQQAKGVAAQASYQSRISDYGQIQNALSTLQSAAQNGQAGQSAALAADAAARAPAGYATQENQLFQNGVNASAASSSLSGITHAVQSVVDAYNAAAQSPLSDAVNSVSAATLSRIGITTGQDGSLSLDTRTLQRALASQPGDVAQVFAGIAGKVSQPQVQVSAVASHIQSGQNPPPAPGFQGSSNPIQVAFASQPSNLHQNPEPAQEVQSRIASGIGPNPVSLAAQYSIVSQLG